MSWNNAYSVGGASWQGNPPLITRNQLFSTTAGLENIVNISTTSTFYTLTALDWISTPVIYVSDIQGAQIDISGGVFATQEVSSSKGDFNLTLASSITMKGIDLGGVKVSFDLGLGQAVGGLLGGLGALVGGGLIAVGTGAGLAIQGAETGIATMIAGRPSNTITSNTYETINFTSQLQVSTLGNLYPVYSTVFRTVSSVSANQVPGKEIYTSTLFYPGQICIRAASDPMNLMTGDSNINSSTIQSFGQWAPLYGLEPDNIIANTIAANYISSGGIEASNISAANVSITQSGRVAYNAPLQFTTGATTLARMIGYNQYLYTQANQGIIYTQPFTATENASLRLGLNANESLMNVSSIFSRGQIQANSGLISSLTVESLTVVSTINLTSTSIANVTSTSIVEANIITANFANISTMAPFTFFSTVLGNPDGRFDITRSDTIFSTAYDQVSSLQQNILKYEFNSEVQDEATFNIGPGTQSPYYTLTPQNISQWGSTILVYDNLYTNGKIDLGYFGQWAASPGDLGIVPGGATFDVLITPNAQGYTRGLLITENSNQSFPYNPSTLVSTGTYDPGSTQTYRFTLPPIVGGSRTGWWSYVTPAGAPYSTSNNNTFQIYQDINDSYIQGTDRLHLVAGDIMLDGNVTFSNFVVGNINANTATISTLSNITLATSFISTSTIQAADITVNPLNGGYNAYYLKSTISYVSPPTSVNPVNFTFSNDSPDYLPRYLIISPLIGSNSFNSYNYSLWNNTIWVNQNSFSLGLPEVFVGDIQSQLGPYSAFFYIDNTYATSPAYSFPIYSIQSSGKQFVGNVVGNTFAKISTPDGISWTVTTVSNPDGTGGKYSNILTVNQDTQTTFVVDNKQLQIQAPQTLIYSGTLGIFADQIRVNSHRYGAAQATGLPSYPIGIENNVYIDSNIAWTYNSGTGQWQSDAQNVLPNFNGKLFYDINAWMVQVIPSRFRTNDQPIVSWDVQPSVLNVAGGGYCWGYNRYILVSGDPGDGANNWNWYLAIPKNYCSYTN